jgi:ribosomal protein S12 methylthiotransferase accessory factor YcaO
LIERDANTLWYLGDADRKAGSRVDPKSFGNRAVDHVIDIIAAAGLHVRRIDQTCDTGVPVFMAIVAMFGGAGRHFEICSGYAANPDPARAALHALCEASQSRITTIASSRDDIDPALFQHPVGQAGIDLFSPEMAVRRPSACSVPKETAEDSIVRLAHQLGSAGIGEPIVVDLAGTALPCRVVRVLCPDLEDMGANANWRPGPRALGALF